MSVIEALAFVVIVFCALGIVGELTLAWWQWRSWKAERSAPNPEPDPHDSPPQRHTEDET